jgi:hypothetical protein
MHQTGPRSFIASSFLSLPDTHAHQLTPFYSADIITISISVVYSFGSPHTPELGSWGQNIQTFHAYTSNQTTSVYGLAPRVQASKQPPPT